MNSVTLLLLPGLHGEGFYFSSLQEILRRQFPCRIISYPKHLCDYEALCAWVCDTLDTETGYIIFAESYGGPLGIMVAEVLGEQVKALILCATYCRPPLPRFLLRCAAAIYPRVIGFSWVAHCINFLVFNNDALAAARAMHQMLTENPDTAIAQRIGNLCNLDERPTASVLEIPCLVLNAKHDRLVWHRNFNCLGNTTIQEISGPHGLAGMKQEAVADAISGFIKTRI